MIGVDRAVRARKRVVRGVTPARWATAFIVVLVVLTAWVSLPAAVRDATIPLAFGLAVVGGIWAFGMVGRLRAGDSRAATTTLSAVVVALVGGALVVALASQEAGRPLRDSALAAAGAFVAGAGESVAPVFYGTYAANRPLFLPLFLFVVWIVNGSSFAHRLRNHPSRWLRSPLVRWPVVFIVSGLMLAVPASMIDRLFDVRAPIEAVGVLAAVPVLALAGVSSLEVLRPRIYPGLPPGWEPASTNRRRRVWTGKRLPVVVVLWLLAVATIPVYVFVSRVRPRLLQEIATDPELTDPGAFRAYNLTLWLLPLLILLVGYQLHTAARRRAALDAATVRAQDTRPWLLYLRSFADDDVRVFAHGSPRRSFFERVLRRRERLEGVLAWHLWRFGPVIGVGQPSERLPRLGSARVYLSDIEWQEQMAERIAAARAIVVVLGRTEGLAWELETIERLGAGDRTIIVVPPLDRREIERRWEAFNDIAMRVGWSPVPADQRTRALVAVAPPNSQERGQQTGGDSARSWNVLVGSARDEWHYEVAIEAALRSLDKHSVTHVVHACEIAATEQRADAAPRDTHPTARPSGESAASFESESARPSRETWRRITPGIFSVIYVIFIAALGSSGETEIVNELRPGTCIRQFEPEFIEEQPHLTNRVEVVPCDAEDSVEVYRNELITGVTYPGEEEVASRVGDICEAGFESFYGISYEESADDVVYWAPTRESWLYGDDDVICARPR